MSLKEKSHQMAMRATGSSSGELLGLACVPLVWLLCLLASATETDDPDFKS